MGTKIHRIGLPRKGQVDNYFGVFDLHISRMHKPTIEIMKAHAKLIPRESRRLVIGGDAAEAEFLMGKPDYLRKIASSATVLEEVILPQAEAEFDAINEFLDEMQKIFDYIYWIDGNHDYRYWLFKEHYSPAAYKHNFDLRKRLSLKDRGIPYIFYNDWLDIGPFISITHGDKHGQYHPKQMLQRVSGRTVFYGHVHHHACFSQFTRGELIRGVSVPTSGEINPGFIKNSDTNWTNGYLSLHVRDNGRFNYYIHENFGGEMIDARGKRYAPKL